MNHRTRHLAVLTVAMTVASVVTIAALVAPQTHLVAQFGERLSEPAMQALDPLAMTVLDDLVGGLFVWVTVTVATWTAAEWTYWLTIARRRAVHS